MSSDPTKDVINALHLPTHAAHLRSAVPLDVASLTAEQGYLRVGSSEGTQPPPSPVLKEGPPSVGEGHSRLNSVVLMDPPSIMDVEGSFVPTPALPGSPQHVKPKHSTCNDRIHSFLDLFVVEPRAANSIGSACTVVVVIASIVYAVVLLLEALGKPLMMQNRVKWSAGKSFPCTFQCLSPSGCLVSNTLKPSEPQPCITVNHLDTVELLMGRSEDPAMGISVAALRSGAEPLASINSDMYMEPDPSLPPNDPMSIGIVDNVVDMPSKLPQGTHLAWYVETHNMTRSGKGRLRREYFVQQVNSDGAVLPSSTSCAVPEGWAQARIRLMPQWNEILVDYETSLMEWFGTSSGMYAAFVSWGAMIVGTWEFWRSAIH
mmetsp:Transcript_18004/g.45387  ORF Transcript_18004/g.45387 Transcript_18004/m.45387 type:complete len:375 (-) Transcript_18004:202-1326(-)